MPKLPKKDTINIYVRRLDTREIVHHVEVHMPSEKKIEAVLRGLLRKLDTETYFVDDSEGDKYFKEN